MLIKTGLRVASLAVFGLAAGLAVVSCVFELHDPLSVGTSPGSCADAAPDAACCEPGEQIACSTGSPGSAVGACKPGVRTCLSEGNGFGECEGEVTPVIESCLSGVDTDCNGKGCSGDMLWVRQFGNEWNQIANGVATDTKGNLFVTGTFEETLTFDALLKSKGGQDIFLVKLDPEGTPLWSRRFGGAEDDESGSVGHGPLVAVDAEGSVVLTGTVYGTADLGSEPVDGAAMDADAFVMKLGADGALLWSKRFTSAGDQKVMSVAVDTTEGSVILTGGMQGAVDFGGGELVSQGDEDLFVVKLSAGGEHLWSRQLGDSKEQRGVSVAVGKDSDIVIAGDLVGTMPFAPDEGIKQLESLDPAKIDILVVKLDPQGKARWARSYGKGPIGGDTIMQRVSGVAVTVSGDILVTGYFHSSLALDNQTLVSKGLADLFLIRFDNNDEQGLVSWAAVFGNELDYQTGWGVATDALGQVLLTGNFAGDVNIGPLTHKGFDHSTTSPDAFILKLNAQRDPVWNRSLIGPGWQVGFSIAADPLGNVIMVGRMNADITSSDVDPPLKNKGGDDILVVKLAP